MREESLELRETNKHERYEDSNLLATAEERY